MASLCEVNALDGSCAGNFRSHAFAGWFGAVAYSAYIGLRAPQVEIFAGLKSGPIAVCPLYY